MKLETKPFLYQVEGSNDKLPGKQMFRALTKKGYKGTFTYTGMASFCMGKGRYLYEWVGNKRYMVGEK